MVLLDVPASWAACLRLNPVMVRLVPHNDARNGAGEMVNGGLNGWGGAALKPPLLHVLEGADQEDQVPSEDQRISESVHRKSPILRAGPSERRGQAKPLPYPPVFIFRVGALLPVCVRQNVAVTRGL